MEDEKNQIVMERIKVLFVIRTLLRAGAERLVVNISNELVRTGRADVAIFTVDKGNEFEDVLDKRVVVKGGEIKFSFSLYKRNHFFNNSYVDFLHSFKPDVIHSHLYYGDILAHSYLYPGAKYFSHQHNSEVQEYNGFQLKNLSKRMITDFYEFVWFKKRLKKFKTTLIACSQGTHEMLDKKLKATPKILMANAIPLPELTFPEKKVDPSHLKLIWVGRFSDAKRPQMAILIANELKKMNLSFLLQMVGVGINEAKCKQLIEQYNLEEYVHLTGLVNDMSSVYLNADLMLHTAVYEGLPMVFIEANSYGIPIVTSDCMPNNELVKNGVNGEVLKSESTKDFANVIVKFAEDISYFSEHSTGAIKVAQKYGIQQYVDKLLNEYQR